MCDSKNGSWPMPRCYKTCDQLPTTDNNQHTIKTAADVQPNLAEVDYITVSCAIGYAMRDNGTIQCDSKNGAWPVPRCYKKCVKLPTPDNSHHTIKTADVQRNLTEVDSIVVSCATGYATRDNESIQCDSNNGSWPMPRCYKTCEKLSITDSNHHTIRMVDVQRNLTEVDYIVVSCATGYVMIDNDTIQCDSKDGSWPMPNCHNSNLLNCRTPPDIEHQKDKTVAMTHYPGITTYTCMDGYQLNAAGIISCQTNGKWSSAPACTPVDCGPPGSIDHQEKYTVTATHYNGTTTYTCLDGYKLNASGTIHCRASGHWSPPPVCNPVDCGTPRNISHEKYKTVTTTFYHGTSTYTCLGGYNLTPAAGNIRCQANATWSSPPVCIPVDCGPPMNISHEQDKRITTTYYPGTTTYKCLPGHNLTPAAGNIRCQANGYWTSPPECIPVDCGPPMYISHENDKRITTTYYHGTTIYTCLDGYTLTPAAGNIRCQANATWSSLPECIPVECGLPIHINHEKDQTVTTTYYPGTSTYTCLDGYNLTPATGNIHCQANATWSSPPVCIPVECGPPNNIRYENDKRITTTSYPGTTTYTCLDGYNLTPAAGNIRCQANATWSSPPVCIPVDCGTPRNISHEKYKTVTTTYYPGTTTYTCLGGYNLTPAAGNIRCQANGRWSSPPVCIPVECGTPMYISHEKDKTVTTTYYPGTSTYTCLDGYNLTPAAGNIRCQANGTWSSLPACIPVDCGTPMYISHEKDKTVTTTYYHGTSTYTCLDGYNLTPAAGNIRCQANGTWSSLPACIPVECGLPNHINHEKDKTVTTTYYHGTTTYTCVDGYNLTPAAGNISCQANGIWSSPPVCIPVECGPPKNISYENDKRITTTHYPGTTTYTCLDGYTLTPAAGNISCQANASWSSTPVCIPVECGPPMNINQEKDKRITTTSYPGTTTYTCLDGYNLTPAAGNIRCQANGHWSSPPACVPVDCNTSPDIHHQKNKTVAMTHYPGITTYTCMDGYLLNATGIISCQANGKWSSAPACIPVECKTLPDIEHQKVKTVTMTHYHGITTYTCMDGYRLNPAGIIRCQANGKWSSAPACTPVVIAACPNAWTRYTGSCYKFMDRKVTWHNAKGYCQDIGGHLARVQSQEENNFLLQTLRDRHFLDNKNNYYYWINGNDIAIENEWVWDNNEKITFFDWSPGEPNSAHGRHEDCIMMVGSGDFHWNDAVCTILCEFICELEDHAQPKLIG